MPSRRKTFHVPSRLFLAVILLLVGVACNNSGGSSATPPPSPLHENVSDLVHATPVIVVGQVTEIKPGRVAGSGEGRLMFNDIFVKVEKPVKGHTPPIIRLEQVAAEGRIFSSEVGPAFERGERDVLFLQLVEGDRYVVMQQGRYQLKRGSVYAVSPGLAGDKVNNMKEDEFVSEIVANTQENQ